MEQKIISLKFSAPAGIGVKSVGQLFSKILIGHQYFVHDYTEYPSLVRGGHNTYQISFSADPVFAPFQKLDYLIALSPGHWQQHTEELKDSTLVLGMDATAENVSKYYDIPFKKIAEEAGSIVTLNTVAIGILANIFGLDDIIVKERISSQFSKATEENLKAYQLGFAYAQQNLANHRHVLPKGDNTSHVSLLDGNESFGWGFLKAGGDFYAAYPMTPATGTLHFLAEKQKDPQYKNLLVIHPEDEISAANMVLGAAFAGKRAATGTSGGGFALMNEAISYAAIAEIGSVFYLVSRPGPATGLPTWTSQGDLLHAVYSGHGEFPLVVLAPGNQKESFEMGKIATNLAAQLQTPIIVLSDKFISESAESVNDLAKEAEEIIYPKVITQIDEPSQFKRFDTSCDDGISALTVPGTPNGAFLANSYEHDQYSFSTEDAATTEQMVDKRFKKAAKALDLVPKAEIYGTDQAKYLIVSFGSTKGTIIEALKILNDSRFAFLQIKTIVPIDPNLKYIFDSFKEIIVIENDRTAQLTTILKSTFNFNPKHQILKYNGRPFYPEELVEKLTQIISSNG